jgi:GR25 family glycosyltransferase involved in LPS biosynthesis
MRTALSKIIRTPVLTTEGLGMKVFYLNLNRRKDRDERFRRLNSAFIDVQRIEAVDGAGLRTEALIRDGVIHEPLEDYTAGGAGTAVSHKKMWELCTANAEPMTVAEDDAVFNRGFSKKASAVLANLPENWDIVLWGWNFDSLLHVDALEGVRQAVMTFEGGSLGPRIPEFQELDYNVVPLRLTAAFGTVCYTISPKGARRLRELCFPLRNEIIPLHALKRTIANHNIDSVMNKYYRALEAYACFPPLVWTEHDQSTSDTARSPEPVAPSIVVTGNC